MIQIEGSIMEKCIPCEKLSKKEKDKLDLVQRESNTHRISADLFGSFGLVVLALRQQGCVLRIQNPANISRRNVRSSFAGADFCPYEKLDAGNTWRIAKDN